MGAMKYRDKKLMQEALAVSIADPSASEFLNKYFPGHTLTKELFAGQEEHGFKLDEQFFTAENWLVIRNKPMGNGCWMHVFTSDRFNDKFELIPDDPAIFDNIEDAKKADSPTPNYYNKTFGGKKLDVYRVLETFGITNHAQAHAIKKLLRMGQKPGESVIDEIDGAIASLRRMKEMIEEDAS